MARHCPRAAQVRPLILTEWRRWHAEQEARFAAERGRNKRECRPDTRQLTVADVEDADCLRALAVERGTVIPVIRDALDELLDRERERHKSELVGATRGLAIAKLEAAASALELALATKRGKVLDLPNPLKSVN